MNEHKVGIGILGCSNIALRRFLPGLLKAKNADLVACASRDLEKARRFCAGGDRAAVGYEDLLRHEGIQAVYISLPNELHEEWTLRSLEAGKHVICEKPLGTDLASVERMIAFAEERKLLLFENIMYLHHPRHRIVKELVGRGEIGRLRHFRSSFGFTLPEPGGFRLSAGPGGGSFQDQARYPLSAALFHLTGSFTDFKGHLLFRKGVNISLTARGLSTNGESFWCSVGFEQPYECWYEVAGDRGTIRVERAYTTPADLATTIDITVGGTARQIAVQPADHFQLMIEYVAGLVGLQRDFSREHEAARRLATAADLLWKGCEQKDGSN